MNKKQNCCETEMLPQLIVALDGLDDDANYIHINDVRDGQVYYCPCCKGIVKPRAFKDNVDYRVQPHFYHEYGGCSEESFVHFICKNWLFEPGCKFIVDNVEYIVSDIQVEKRLHTSFGDYQPDIIVTTTAGKVFYFEIKFANKKKNDCIPKWDELGNAVVEVDTRYFVNQKYTGEIPMFNLIYSDGNCFIKTYEPKNYDRIANRKLEWKRQDKLNYKIKWERLDWFWNTLSLATDDNLDDLLSSFAAMDYDDQVWCYQNFVKKKCVANKDKFQEIVNQSFFENLSSLSREHDIYISSFHKSPLIYEIKYQFGLIYRDYHLSDWFTKKVKLINGIIDYPVVSIKKDISNLLNLRDRCIRQLKIIEELITLPYIFDIYPISHISAARSQLSNLVFAVQFEEFVRDYNESVRIGTSEYNFMEISRDHLSSQYELFHKKLMTKLEQEKYVEKIKSNKDYINCIQDIQNRCSQYPYLRVFVSDDYTNLYLMNDLKCLKDFIYQETLIPGTFEEDLRKEFFKVIDKESIACERRKQKRDAISNLILQINTCKNNHWKIKKKHGNKLLLEFYINDKEIANSYISLDFNSDHPEKILKNRITTAMRNLIRKDYKDIRIMEER